MRKLDLFWKSNHDWWEFKDGIPVLREVAPQEARESYEHYLVQMSEERIRINGRKLIAFLNKTVKKGIVL